MSLSEIKWEDQHCGVIQASSQQFALLMSRVYQSVIPSFPEKASDFIWDVKVHMLMKGQYPCIPNWHYDNIPRVAGKQDFSLIKPEVPMYLWLSGTPLTEFEDGRPIQPKTWVKFNQLDKHRGTVAEESCWRCFIRATHRDIHVEKPVINNALRRHSQVYLDASNFTW